MDKYEKFDKFEIAVPVLFGLEAFAAREIRRLGYETLTVEDGRVVFEGGYRENALRNAAYDIAKLKLCSGKRTTADADAGQEMMENKCSFPEKA